MRQLCVSYTSNTQNLCKFTVTIVLWYLNNSNYLFNMYFAVINLESHSNVFIKASDNNISST